MTFWAAALASSCLIPWRRVRGLGVTRSFFTTAKPYRGSVLYPLHHLRLLSTSIPRKTSSEDRRRAPLTGISLYSSHSHMRGFDSATNCYQLRLVSTSTNSDGSTRSSTDRPLSVNIKSAPIDDTSCKTSASPNPVSSEVPSPGPDCSSSPQFPDSPRRLLKRCWIIIGVVGFLAGILYDQRRQQGVPQEGISTGFPKLSIQKSFFSRENIENTGEAVTEYFLDLLDKILPHPTTPLLPDAADLKYPENLPTLVVDLDKVIVKMEHDRKLGWRVLKRPGADEFFKELVYHYEIVVWSDDSFPVAQDVCAKWGLPVVGALHRDQCKKRKGHYIKDLSRLGRRLERVLLLDHDAAAFSLQPGNGILIREFDGNPNDTDLIALTEFLKMAALSSHTDIRDFIEDHGGGDVDLVKRWVVEQAEKEKKTETRRTIGMRLFGTGRSTQTNNTWPPQATLSPI